MDSCTRQVKLARLFTRACNRGDATDIEIQPTDEMILGVGNVEDVTIQRYPLWMVEGCCGKIPSV